VRGMMIPIDQDDYSVVVKLRTRGGGKFIGAQK
jgi:hypothetical protein